MQAWEEKYYEREEAREYGEKSKLKDIIRKMHAKGKTVREIEELLDEDARFIQSVIDEIR